jgi:radical SAM superfamily enzyme YgiQ (UPF0313 family)
MVEMKKVLFLEINSSYSHSMLSYCLIRAFCEQQATDWQWHHIDGTLKNSIYELLDAAVELEPDLILGTAYIFNIDFLCQLVAKIKQKLPDSRIVLGGPSFLGNNESFLRNNSAVDAVIRGDESTVPLLLNDDWMASEGLCYITQTGDYKDNGIADFDDELDSLPSPYQAGLIHTGKPFFQLETSRGCRGRCVFCTSSLSHKVKFFSLDRVRMDLQALHHAGYREIRLIDRTFNEQPQRAVDMLNMFYTEFYDMRFHLEIEPGKLCEPVTEALKKAPEGMLHLEAGVQTFDTEVLKKIRRPASAAATREGLKKLVDNPSFEVHADLIAGLPGQTLESVMQDVDTMVSIGPEEIQLEVLKLLPGTELAAKPPKGMEYNSLPPWDITATKDMAADQIRYAAFVSHVLDSWYNTPGLQNVFRFAHQRIDNFLKKFCEFTEAYCHPSKGKLPLEKRYKICNEFLKSHDKLCYELSIFSTVAAGFVVPDLELRKYPLNEAEDEQDIWQRPDIPANIKIKRCITLECSFDAADIWSGFSTGIVEGRHLYMFKLHYGRNVAQIVKVRYLP